MATSSLLNTALIAVFANTALAGDAKVDPTRKSPIKAEYKEKSGLQKLIDDRTPDEEFADVKDDSTKKLMALKKSLSASISKLGKLDPNNILSNPLLDLVLGKPTP